MLSTVANECSVAKDMVQLTMGTAVLPSPARD